MEGRISSSEWNNMHIKSVEMINEVANSDQVLTNNTIDHVLIKIKLLLTNSTQITYLIAIKYFFLNRHSFLGSQLREVSTI